MGGRKITAPILFTAPPLSGGFMYITKRGAIYILGWGGGSEGRTQHDIHELIHSSRAKTCWPSLTPSLHLSPHGITRLLVIHCADHLLVHTNSAIIIHMFLVSILTASTHPSCTIISFTSHNSIIPHPSFHHLYILTVLL